MKIRLAENFRAVFYAPVYAMKALDFAASEGVDIDWVHFGSPGGAIDALKLGQVDLTWGGPMRVMKDHDSTPADGASLISVGEIVSHDPFYLIGRAEGAVFDLSRLRSLRLGVVAEVPTPWLCLQADLRDADIDVQALIDSARIKTGLTMPQQLAALKRSEIDVVQVFEPYVSQALSENLGTLLYAANGRGPTVYTTFICTRDALRSQRDAIEAIVRALARVQEWIRKNGPAELARLVAPFFLDESPLLLRTAIERYCRDGVWGQGTVVSRPGFDRLAHSLLQGKFIASPCSYESCVHNFEDVAA